MIIAQGEREARSPGYNAPNIISPLSPSDGVRGSLGSINHHPSTINQLWDGHSDSIFIPARVTDNQYNNPEYRKVLESLNGWQKRAWLDGDWDLAAGQFFTNFRRDIHIVTDPPARSASTTLNPQLLFAPASSSINAAAALSKPCQISSTTPTAQKTS